MKQLLCIFIGLLGLVTTAQGAKFSVTEGRLVSHTGFASEHILPRDVHVWLPPGYDDKLRYPVLYMHDGQMLFDRTVTWNKQEWGVDDVAGRLIREGKVDAFVVVAVENISERRHAEYFPQKSLQYFSEAERAGGHDLFKGQWMADDYLRFLVRELKPFIDKTYAVDPSFEATSIAGSSMGGLISLYAVSEYPDVFSAAICMSTHWVGINPGDPLPVARAMREFYSDALPLAGRHRIYFDYGTETLDQYYPPLQAKMDAVMRDKGYSDKDWLTRAFPGHKHDEVAWNSRLDVPLTFLFGRAR